MDDPFSWKNIIPTLWMVFVASLGGAVSFRQKVKDGHSRPWNLTEFIGEMFVSAVAGLITYWICKGVGMNEYLTAAAVAISGHMGARAFFLAERTLEQVAEKFRDRV